MLRGCYGRVAIYLAIHLGFEDRAGPGNRNGEPSPIKGLRTFRFSARLS